MCRVKLEISVVMASLCFESCIYLTNDIPQNIISASLKPATMFKILDMVSIQNFESDSDIILKIFSKSS